MFMEENIGLYHHLGLNFCKTLWKLCNNTMIECCWKRTLLNKQGISWWLKDVSCRWIKWKQLSQENQQSFYIYVVPKPICISMFLLCEKCQVGTMTLTW